ncbi:MAG: hypothetical protein M2R45_04975 [Verrucomicrobia subdivision 3 bacterium]|nr:hypothetical protein [Limisphaerales bacterium]MCS1414078.1 hypothetical protein [Limisphaerales bacterium]
MTARKRFASRGKAVRFSGMSLKTLLAFLALGPCCLVQGQVTVKVDFEKDFYIADETMLASVRITNFSGRSLTFGKDNHWLMFSVEKSNGFLADQDGNPSVIGEFEIPNASRGIRRVNLAPYYKMSDPGRYQVTATVFCQELKEVLKSPPTEVNIIRATTLWQKEFGVTSGDDTHYEVRNYALIRALNNNQLELYVRVARRDDSKVFGTFPVGNLVSFGAPEVQVDRLSRLHLLQQYRARSFRYLVVTPDGELMIRQRYDYTKTRPKLGADAEHLVTVVGGVRVPSLNDLPPSPVKEVSGVLSTQEPSCPGLVEN